MKPSRSVHRKKKKKVAKGHNAKTKTNTLMQNSKNLN
jgi:hypothetical protein